MMPLFDNKGIWVPIITPMYQGVFDRESMVKLIGELEPHVDGFVPALSSGEGQALSVDEWREVVRCVADVAQKPVFAGIVGLSVVESRKRIQTAESLGCDGVVLSCTEHTDPASMLADYRQLAATTKLPIIVYNTKHAPFTERVHFEKLAQILNVVAIKDSSGNQALFDQLADLRRQGTFRLALLQGMENQIRASRNGDGLVVSLANLEAQLLAEYFREGTELAANQIDHYWWQYNLVGSQWYVTVKALLFARGSIRSAEQVSGKEDNI